ncbi:Protein dachsous [Gryllus bimaculatus]|nr:Protein dachsous [Gryllus bimaculatus]
MGLGSNTSMGDDTRGDGRAGHSQFLGLEVGTAWRALLFLWANYAAAAPEWPLPFFLEVENSNANLTWKPAAYQTNALLSLWEGTEGNIVLTRLSYKPDGEEKPNILSGGGGLGIKLQNDGSSSTPFYLEATEPGDYEAGEERFVVRLNEPSASPNTGVVTVELVNVNDNAPIISSPASCLVEEEYVGPTDCEFIVTDPDGGACYARMLVDDEKFSLHLSSGQTQGCKTATFILHVDSELDYETFRLHSLVITAEDDGQVGPNDFLAGNFYQERVVQFVVDVDDIPDEPPRWEKIVPSVTVDEKTDWTEQIRAIDGDYGLNWPIVYHLEFPDDGFDYHIYFAIDKETGVLTGLGMNRDYLQREIYRFVVVATEVPPPEFPDFKAMSTPNDIVVMLIDKNDNIPEMEPTRVEYLEYPEEQPFTDRNITVNDPDLADHGTFHLTLEENFWSSNFLLIPSSGYQEVTLTISALDPSRLDYEDPEWRNIELTQRRKQIRHVSKAVLKIELFDLIDEPPEFEKEEYTVSFTENQPEGFHVVQTIAKDPDENDIISYTITHTLLEIDEDGLITSKSANAFDYERQTEMSFQVVATDTGNFKDFCQVTIKIIDINDEQPTLIMPPNRLAVNEHDPVGTPASYDITATDPDTEAKLRFEIDWENSSGYTQGVEIFDDTIYKTFLISGILTVIVGDINDNPPVFVDKENRDNFTVTENTKAGRVIGSLTATDADSPEHNKITYSIEPSFPPELVAGKEKPRLVINPDTGVLSTTDEAIDCDDWQTLIYKYKVSAADKNYTTTEEITVYIEDENDVLPDVIEPEGYKNTTSFKEHTPGPQLLSCIQGVDNDYSEDFHTITYFFIEGKFVELFEMESPCKTLESCCLWAKDGTDMDRDEGEETYEIEVFSRDNYEDRMLWRSNSGPTVTITLNLEDINDNSPIFQNQGPVGDSSETLPEEGYKFFDVEVTDKDIGLNGVIDCEEDPEVTSEPAGRPDGLFTVKTETQVVDGVTKYRCAVHATRKFEGLWGVYTLKLTANDRGEEKSDPGVGVYVLKVAGENLNDPTIEYPESGSVIRLRRNQDPDNGKPLIDYTTNSGIENFITNDIDDPSTLNGQVELKLTEEVFGVVEVLKHTFRLVLKVPKIPEDKKQFPVTLQAFDRPGSDGQRSSNPPTSINIYVIDADSTPAFTERDAIVSFTENTTGLVESRSLPQARNLDEELLELEVRRQIYYYIIGGEAEYFLLDKNTGVLTLQKMLDYENVTQHKIIVGATHAEEQPPSDNFYGNAILEVTVKVDDINDMPPFFLQEVFPGVFSVDHEQGTHILDLKAEDPDTNDELNFVIIPGTMEASTESLKPFENNAFSVNLKTGAITLNFSPGGRQLDGYFSFDVKVYDKLGDIHGHRDTASVKVYVVSGTHQMIFFFFNPVDVVEAKQDDMEKEFSRVLGYTCTVDKVRRASADNVIETSEVVSYFLNEKDNSPVPREKIEEEFLKTNTNSELYQAMQDLSLSFRGYNNADSEKERGSYMTIVLAAVCAVLAVLVVVFSLAFVVRTRTLKNRLEKLTNKKFGSQDSGLNRDSMAVPGTNVHALEGSNPVWNHDIDRSFDNMSESSGDSDLIGIEDSPEFNDQEGGVQNRAYEPRASADQFEETFGQIETQPRYDDLPRRTSINPLAAAAAAEDRGFEALSDPGPLSLDDIGLPRKISLNPLAAGFDSELDSVEVDVDGDVGAEQAPGNANFSFQRPAEPSTEL